MIPAKSSPTQMRFTLGRNSAREHWFRATTPDLARHVSKTGLRAPHLNPRKQSCRPQRPRLRRKEPETMADNEFRISEVPPGSALLVGDVAVFNVAGSFCATQDKCTHKQGPLSKGKLDGSTVTCPLHGSQFNVCTGEVLHGPATDPLKTYQVILDGEIGRIEAGAAAVAKTTSRTA